MDEDGSPEQDGPRGEDGDDPPLITGLELIHEAITKKAPRELLGKQAGALFEDRKQQRPLTLVQLILNYVLAGGVLGCLTWLIATEAIPKDAALCWGRSSAQCSSTAGKTDDA